MTNPHGLGIDGNYLFVCDAEAGLKVYNCANPSNLVLLSTIINIYPIDVIPINKTLFVVTNAGFKIYDYSNISDIRLISSM